MKYELVLLCSFVAGSLFGQYEYQPLVEEGATWSTGFACDYCGSHPEFYTISGDTILDGTPYKKLMYAGSWVDNGFNFEYDYLGGIREDSLRRVYYKGENLPNYLCCDAIDFSQELLMYDFGVEVGDTIFDGLNCYYFPPIGAGYRVVDQIDTIEIGGDLRKRFTLRWVKYDGGGTCCDYHIEGLGYEYGFFPFCIHFEWTWITACHTDSSMDYDITPCLLFSECYARGVSTQEVKKSAIEVFPNPSQGLISVRLTETVDVDFLVIYDLSGKELYSVPLNAGSLEIDISSLPQGVYLLQAKDLSGTVRTKGEMLVVSE